MMDSENSFSTDRVKVDTSIIYTMVQEKISATISSLAQQLLSVPMVTCVMVSGDFGITVNNHLALHFSLSHSSSDQTAQCQASNDAGMQHQQEEIDQKPDVSLDCVLGVNSSCDTPLHVETRSGSSTASERARLPVNDGPSLEVKSTQIRATSGKVKGVPRHLSGPEKVPQKRRKGKQRKQPAAESNASVPDRRCNKDTDGSNIPAYVHWTVEQTSSDALIPSAENDSYQTVQVSTTSGNDKDNRDDSKVSVELAESSSQGGTETVKPIEEPIENSKTGMLECSICGKNYPSDKARVFRRHVKQHSKRVQCETCGKWFASMHYLKVHQRGLHKDEKPYSCKECGKTFNFGHSLRLHLLKHTGARPFPCPHCSKTYLVASHLNQHIARRHTASSQKSQRKRFQCKACGRSYLWARDLKTHLLSHSNHRPFKCSICSKDFTTKQTLRTHQQTKHVERPKAQCDICHKFYKSERLRDIHKQLRHTNCEDVKSRFMCDICGQQFMYKSNLEAHSRIHKDERPLICTICGKGFKLASSLYAHKYTHTEETPFKCSICSKAFKTKTLCVAHEKRHNATKSFICDKCGAAFPDKGGLTKHTKTIHVVARMFQCTICGKIGPRRDNMQTHIKSHVRDVPADQLSKYVKEVN